MKFLIFFFLGINFFGCSNSNGQNNMDSLNSVSDSIPKPKGVNDSAWLIDLGFDDHPVRFWVENIGFLKIGEKEFPHILAFKYSDFSGKSSRMIYYEFANGRDGSRIHNTENFEIIPFPGDATIKLVNENSEFILYQVLENHEFDRIHNHLQLFRIPSIEYSDLEKGQVLVSGYDMEINLEESGEGEYIATFLDMEKGIRSVNYQVCSGCKFDSLKISYLNREDGRIYLIEKNHYLELVVPGDLTKI